MAKIGNEAKLILKLAKERMNKQHTEWLNSSGNPSFESSKPDWLKGYERCLHEFNGILFDVVEELEQK